MLMELQESSISNACNTERQNNCGNVIRRKKFSLIMISFHSKFYEGVNYIGSNMIKVSVKGTKKRFISFIISVYNNESAKDNSHTSLLRKDSGINSNFVFENGRTFSCEKSSSCVV